MFIDPWGLAHYVYHGPDREDAANATRQQLIDDGIAEDEIIMINVKKANDMIDFWNDEMGKNDPIDAVFIHTHGHDDYLTNNEGIMRIYVSDLDSKTIGTILLTVCNTRNMNNDNNVAV